MKGVWAAEHVINPVINLPYYRFRLRTETRLGTRNQHYLLVELANSGSLVYYVAPAFYIQYTFNMLFTQKQILQTSVFVEPNRIGHLPGSSKHTVVFHENQLNQYWLCSEPSVIKKSIDFDSFLKSISTYWKMDRVIRYDLNNIQQLKEKMIEIIKETSPFFPKALPFIETLKMIEGNYSLMAQISYLARIYFNCQFLLVHPKE